MVESDELDGQTATKRNRTPGVRYPGASLRRVQQILTVLDGAGGTATIGTLAARVRLSEKNTEFVRLIASARSYGVAEWANASKSALRLSAEGRAVLGDDEDAAAARRRAALRPDIFQTVARAFEGRSLPTGEDLQEAFVVSGVAPSAAPLAGRNFVESLEFAGLIDEESGRQLLQADLPFPEPESTSDALTARPVRTGSVGVASRPPTPRPAGAAVRSQAAARPASGAAPHTSRSNAGVAVTVKLDVSGWEVEKVVDLVKRLREAES